MEALTLSRGARRAARERPMPIHFSDTQLSEIFRLTAPLAPACRDRLLQILAAELGDRSDVGDGELHRRMCAIIKDHHLFEAPSAYDTGGTGRRRSA
jgi:hypothetical protein